MNTKLERIQRDIEEISKFTSTPGMGTTRFSFTEEDRSAREYIKNEMINAGLKVYEDAAGTVFGRFEGELNDVPVVMIGSHFDSVKNGGSFDGPAGVVAALEIARVFKDKNLKPKYPIEFIAMIEEEGGRFGGGLFGSRAMAGKVQIEELDSFIDENGISIVQAMKNFGLDPDNIEKAARRREHVKAFIELHIEQGPILEAKNKDIGIVEYIVGIKEIEVSIKGRPDHAGTTPMNMRSDALEAAASLISRIGDFARDAGDGTVATVGKLKVLPGAANIVPGEVVFTIDIRSKESKHIISISNRIIEELNKLVEVKGVKFTAVDKLNVPPVKLEDYIIESLDKNCNNLGFSSERMLSGAGHDAMVMADITDVGMIFVPSRNGRSHCPEEWTDYDKLQKGIEVAYETIKDLADI
jgi:allantoate deiminase